MKFYLAVALGGAIGSAGRYFVAGQMMRWLGPGFPWGTLTVNIVGAFAMGVLIELLALKYAISPELRAFFVVGVLGGFTTFSAFALDVSVLVERHAGLLAAAYAAASVFLSVGALFLGLFIIRQLLD